MPLNPLFLLFLQLLFFIISIINAFCIMEKVQVLDKTFRIYIPAAEIAKRVGEIAQELSRDYARKNPLFLAVLNGAFMFSSDLFKCVNIPAEISFVKVASYEGTDTTGSVSELIGLNEDIEGRHVVILEDIIDTGGSMYSLLNTLEAKKPASVAIASLLLKPEKLQHPIKVDYCGFKIPNDFVVGYGMDYDRFGRNLPDLYVLSK